MKRVRHEVSTGSRIRVSISCRWSVGVRLAAALIMAMLCVAGGAAYSADYYVSTTGNDTTGNGSMSRPWKTIQKGADSVSAGDTVHVLAGAYPNPVYSTHSGTADNPITFVSDTRWGAVLSLTNSDWVWRNGGNYVTIQGFDISSPDNSSNGARIGIWNDGSHCRIIGNHVHDIPASAGAYDGNGGAGIDNTNYQGGFVDVIGNVVHDIGPAVSNGSIHGIYVANAYNTVQNNISYRNSGFGIHCWHAAAHGIISNNLVFGNLYGGIIIGSGDNGVGTGTGDNFLVTNNIVVWNYSPYGLSICEIGQAGPHNVYADNLCYGNGDDDYSVDVSETPTGTIIADPLLVNFQDDGSGDYHLTPGSPAKDTGTSLGAPAADLDGITRPVDSGYDRGPYEYIAAPQVSITSPSDTGSYATYSSTVDLGGKVASPRAISTVRWANASTGLNGNCSYDTGSGTWSINNVQLSAGENVITITATDSNGNSGSATINVTYFSDAMPPTITITSPTTNPTFRTTNVSIDLAGTSSDDTGVSRVSWSNSAMGGSGTCTGTTNWSAAGIGLQPGMNTITVTAVDACRNEGTATLQVYRDVIPANLSLTPHSGGVAVGDRITFTSRHSDQNGYADVSYCQLLLNTTYGVAANSVYARYDTVANKLYLKNDGNTGWLGGFAPGSGNVIENSQCKLYCSETTATGSGNELTVNWKIELKPSMLGKTLTEWLYVSDKAGLVHGWDRMGAVRVSHRPANMTLTPRNGTYLPGQRVTITSTYADADGYSDMESCYTLLNTTSGVAANSVYLMYSASRNKLYLKNDAGTGWIGGFAPGSANFLENSQCKVYCADTRISGTGTQRTVTWSIEFKASLAGKSLLEWLYVCDQAGLTDGWDRVGAIQVSRPPSNTSLYPTSGILAVGTKSTLTCQYSDPDGYGDIAYAFLLLNRSYGSGANSVYAVYNQKVNLLYLKNDTNTGWLGGFAPGSANTMENAQCKVYCAETTVSRTGTYLAVTWSVQPKSPMGWQSWTEWLMVTDKANLTDGWDKMGVVSVQ